MRQELPFEKKSAPFPSLCIHRAAREIGGSCIEIRASSGERILLDAGLPLDNQNNVEEGRELSEDIPSTLDITSPLLGVLLSHSHGDHSGLLEVLPETWPIYCGAATEKLFRLTASVFGKTIRQNCRHWQSDTTFDIGPFRVTPMLVDHSAFDAYALLIEVDGNRIFYSGDFRTHGRKAWSTKQLMENPPSDIDVLLIEGTNMRMLSPDDSRAKTTCSEDELVDTFAELFRNAPGRVFITCASTNIDRLVSLYKACRKCKRTLVLDLYTMHVLMELGEFAQLPQPGTHQGFCAVATKRIGRLMKRMGQDDIVEKLIELKSAMSAKRLADTPEKWVIIIRSSLVEDFRTSGVVPDERDTWLWSMWHGYRDKENNVQLNDFLQPCRYEEIHTSGHAIPDVLTDFVKRVSPHVLIPVHCDCPEEFAKKFPNAHVADNGIWIPMPKRS